MNGCTRKHVLSVRLIQSINSINHCKGLEKFAPAMAERTRNATSDENGVICSAQVIDCNLDRELSHQANYRDLDE